MTIIERVGNLNRDLEMRSKAADFVRIAQALAAGGTWSGAAAHAKAKDFSQRAVDVIQKAIVSPVGMSSALSESGLVAAFVDSLRNAGAFDFMFPFCVRVPMKTKATLITLGATGATVGENQVKKISSLALEDSTLDALKAIAIVVISEELARSTSPAVFTLFGNALRGAVALETDREFLRIITAGISATASSGTTEAAVRNDIRTLLTSVTTGAASSLFFITTSTIAKQLATVSDDDSFPDAKWNGGEIVGVPVLVSDAVSSGELILVDAAGIAADTAEIELDDAKHATLDLNDAPDSPTTGTTMLTSLWSHNLTAIRSTRYFGCERLRTSAVAIISGVDFDGDSP